MNAFLANLKIAIRNRETVTIAGGQFQTNELRDVADALSNPIPAMIGYLEQLRDDAQATDPNHALWISRVMGNVRKL